MVDAAAIDAAAMRRAPASATTIGDAATTLSDDQVRAFIRAELDALPLDGRRVCVLVPDATRTCPLPLLAGVVRDALQERATRITFLVALGTHAPMSDRALTAHVGFPPADGGAGRAEVDVRNHAWADPSALVTLGEIAGSRMADLSAGRLRDPVPVRVNRSVVDHDVVLVVGPVFPHEVVGFSGGNKYLFPGVSGREFIDVSHWLGALISSAEIIGTLGRTPVRALIDEAAAMVPSERFAFCAVTGDAGPSLHSLSFGAPEPSWEAAAAVAAQAHVRSLDAPVRRVLSLVPERYDDLWTGAKGFYKVEPVVADGGQVVLHAPHITEIAAMHPAIAEVGYHCRDYFLGQWEQFSHVSWGDLAHSTHLRGAGVWDPSSGERCRVTVTLATGIPEEVVRGVGLDHLDPATIDVDAWSADPDTLVVPDAGENLYRLR